ncbi:MAG TPA: LamG domain-containing protein, partial [Polyangiaceae bacterium]|nr:LamG domain-containing protein [Polyangiaceae bacterium]
MQRNIDRRYGSPLVWALALAAACSSGSEKGGTSAKNVETFDEAIEPLQVASPPGAAAEALDGGAPTDASTEGGSGGTGGISSGGSAGAPQGGTGGIGEGGSAGTFGGTGGIGEGGSSGAPGGTGGIGEGGGPSGAPSAFWEMNDCSAVTRTLLDSSGNGIHATRTASARCGTGISGQGVVFDEAKDRIEALNAPQFELDDSLAVAAFIKPSNADNNRPIVIKRRNDDTAFSLRLQNNQIQFTVTLEGSNKAVTTRAPITLNEWSHVAGVFDGEFVFLFVNGRQVGQVTARGSIADVNAPIRIGSTTQTQHFVGTLDNVWISTNGVTPGTIAGLACIRGQSELAINPLTSGPVPAGTEFT